MSRADIGRTKRPRTVNATNKQRPRFVCPSAKYLSSDETGSSEPVFVTLGAADGTFLERKRIGQQRHATFPVKVRAADIDGDGSIDLVVSDFQATALWLFLGDGHGNFSTPISIDTGAPVNDFELADLTGDGTIDIVTANTDHTASVLTNLGRSVRHRAVRP